MQTGNESLTIQKGNRTIEIDQGNQSTTIKQGNRTVEIDQGNDTLTIKQGNLSIQMNAGSGTDGSRPDNHAEGRVQQYRDRTRRGSR